MFSPLQFEAFANLKRQLDLFHKVMSGEAVSDKKYYSDPSKFSNLMKERWLVKTDHCGHLLEIPAMREAIEDIVATRSRDDKGAKKGVLTKLNELVAFGESIGLDGEEEQEVAEVVAELPDDGLTVFERLGHSMKLYAQRASEGFRPNHAVNVTYGKGFISYVVIKRSETFLRNIESDNKADLADFEERFKVSTELCKRKLNEAGIVMLRIYLRASTKTQDEERAVESMTNWLQGYGYDIDSTQPLNPEMFYIDNESGAEESREELDRLFDECLEGDLLIIEKIDRLTRLEWDSWIKLKTRIKEERLIIVSKDLPFTHQFLDKDRSQEEISGLSNIFNEVLLDFLAIIARDDLITRRVRGLQGMSKIDLDEDKKRGKQINTELHKKAVGIIKQIHAGTFPQTIKRDNCKEITGYSKSRFDTIKTEFETGIVREAVENKTKYEKVMLDNKWLTESRYLQLKSNAQKDIAFDLLCDRESPKVVRKKTGITQDELDILVVKAAKALCPKMFYRDGNLEEVAKMLHVMPGTIQDLHDKRLGTLVRYQLANDVEECDIIATYHVDTAYVEEQRKILYKESMGKK